MACESLEVRPVPAHMLVASWRDSFFIADMLSGLARGKLCMSEPRRSKYAKASKTPFELWGKYASAGAIALD